MCDPLPKVWTNLSVLNPVYVDAEQAGLLSRSGHLHRGPIGYGPVRPNMVVVLAPRSNFSASIFDVQKPVLIETLQSKAAVECLDKYIIRGLFRS